MQSLTNIKKVHMIGIKGAGMTALAEMLAKGGARVTGSDVPETFFTDAILRGLGIEVREAFDPANIPADTELVVYSTAYAPETNPELKAAFAGGKRPVSYPEALGALMKERLGLAVCGTHGKTTTSALLAEVLREAGEDPSAIVGSRILQWDGGALSGGGKYFVVEADEYQNKFRHYNPFGVILTSLDWDHPDFFPTFEAYREAFVGLIRRIPAHGVLVSWGDSVAVGEAAAEGKCRRLTYGFVAGNDFQIANHRVSAIVEASAGEEFSETEALPEISDIRQSFEVLHEGESLGWFELQLAGRHNALNATAVIALCEFLKVDIEKVREGLRNFVGTERRFEYIGERGGVLFYDDYAHHPEEIKATLQAFRDLYPNRRLIAAFHPHTFTRTKALLADFAQSFALAHKAVVLDIYGSAREKQGGVSSRELVELINSYSRGKAVHMPGISEAVRDIREEMRSGDLVVTLGAGNVWEVSHALAREKSVEE
jgi:UDP-N-acetylmuramate--alanine ligase